MKYSYLFLLCSFVAIWSCSDDADDDVTEVCVTENITYTDGAAAILNTSCATPGCHADGNNATFAMDTYEKAAEAVTFGRIIGAINHQADFKPMPYPEGSDKLSQCDIDKLTAWVEAGGPE